MCGILGSPQMITQLIQQNPEMAKQLGLPAGASSQAAGAGGGANAFYNNPTNTQKPTVTAPPQGANTNAPIVPGATTPAADTTTTSKPVTATAPTTNAGQGEIATKANSATDRAKKVKAKRTVLTSPVDVLNDTLLSGKTLIGG